jgi:hypothetical protein
MNAIRTILTVPGALTKFYESYQKYINYGFSFIGLTDLSRPNSIIVATMTALIQTIAEFIPTPGDSLNALLNTGVNVATILYQGLPILLPGLIAYGCSTAGEALVRGTIKRARMAVTDPLGTAREMTARVADVRDIVRRLLAQGPRLFFGNLARGAFNALLERIDPEARFHRLEEAGAAGAAAAAAPAAAAAAVTAAESAGMAREAAAPGMQPVLDAVLLVPDVRFEDIRVIVNDLLEEPIQEPAQAVVGGPPGMTQEERDALLGLLDLAEQVALLPPEGGGKKKRKYKTAKNKRATPRRKRMSKKNLRHRY